MLKRWRSNAKILARHGGDGRVSDLVAVLPSNFCTGGAWHDRRSCLDMVGNPRTQEDDANTDTEILIREIRRRAVHLR